MTNPFAGILTTIERVLLGLGLVAGGVFFLNRETATPPTHTIHVILFVCIAFVGVLILGGRFVFPVIQQVVVIVSPYLPRVGGRRAGDPPAGDGQ